MVYSWYEHGYYEFPDNYEQIFTEIQVPTIVFQLILLRFNELRIRRTKFNRPLDEVLL